MSAELITIAMGIAAAIAAQACLLGCVNLFRYRRVLARPASEPALPGLVSVCIPARNEEANIEACVESLLASQGVAVEVLCYDDQSTDRTSEILARLRAADPRVRTPPTLPLPEGWNGKQHACQRLGEAAKGDWLLFTDADVRFEPGCVAAAVAEARRSDVALLSTVPAQITATLGEALLVPLIHFLLLSYLPIGRMRSTLDPAASAGCGQFLLVRSDAYRSCGGHTAFRDSMHDGIKMPRVLRAAGHRTDIADLTELVRCRMYRGLAQTWRGFAKNAYEGLGSLWLLVFLTLLHAGGHVLPWAFLVGSALVGRPADLATWCAIAAVGFATVERLALALRFGQSLAVIPLHPVGITLMAAVQWWSLLLSVLGRRAWKGRVAGGLVS